MLGFWIVAAIFYIIWMIVINLFSILRFLVKASLAIGVFAAGVWLYDTCADAGPFLIAHWKIGLLAVSLGGIAIGKITTGKFA